MKKNIYAVTMYRWGDKEAHSYLIGVFDKKQKAIDEGQKEEEHRGGGKYRAEIIETEINESLAGIMKSDVFKTIKEADEKW